MSVDKAQEFLKDLKANGPSPELMKKIGSEFQSEHMHEALKANGTSKDELLKGASGGSSAEWGADTIYVPAGAQGAKCLKMSRAIVAPP